MHNYKFLGRGWHTFWGSLIQIHYGKRKETNLQNHLCQSSKMDGAIFEAVLQKGKRAVKKER